MIEHTAPILETPNFIILDKYEPIESLSESFQSEEDLEKEFINDLKNQGYEYRPEIRTPKALLDNLKTQIEALNNVRFNPSEWQRFLEEFLDKASDGTIEKSRKIHNNYICDFTFDDGRLQNIYLVDKKTIARNKVQVINQFEQTGEHTNRYDVTILVNGLPLAQIELKRRGIAIKEAFNQVHRYSKESFNSESSLYKYLQAFIISNGTDTRYFANTTKRDKNSYDFTMEWARADNTPIKDLKDFTATFLQKNTLLNIILTYAVLDVDDNLLLMRPYQIAATERILWKIKSSYNAKKWADIHGGGFIWHTTGSGKTLTSFKAARLATELDFIDKVFFVVDRKDLDYQTMKEYQRFSPDSVNGSDSTAGLKKNIQKDDNKIIVTTIQKLNILMKSEADLPIYGKQVVFIFDECHRSQFGEAQKNLKKKFKYYYQFGFTGTPIFPENALGTETTASVFGTELHSYVITDAIRDDKVLKFKVDYNNVKAKFKNEESADNITEQDKVKLKLTEKALLHPERVKEISQYILRHFHQKTHRLYGNTGGFNAMFAVNSVDAAKLYYETLNNLQKQHPYPDKPPLKIATIFSFVANEDQDAIGDIADETFEPTALDCTAKEFLSKAIDDYNALFKTNFGVDSKEFQNYYRDLAKKVKDKEVDLLIVVGMFLTGFDAPRLNTLFVDKNLRYHGLIQAYSRTNRIYDATKTFGNVVTFRDLEKETATAIELFGKSNTKNMVLEKSYQEYMEGFKDIITGEARRGFIEVNKALESQFPNPSAIETEADKKGFVKLFGEYLRLENILQNYDEFSALKNAQNLDTKDPKALEAFQETYQIDKEKIKELQAIPLPSERKLQDYKSTYNDIREMIVRGKIDGDKSGGKDELITWGDIVFEVELLKSQEINLDYILALLFNHSKKSHDKEELIKEVRRIIRSSIGNRAKESLLVDFIEEMDFEDIPDKESLIEAFFTYARIEYDKEEQNIIDEHNLKPDLARRYIALSLKRGYPSEYGTDLNGILPKISPLKPEHRTQKQNVLQKITAFVEKFKDINNRG
ncbi:type I restriction endonuclease subunit R [Helicobacter sp. 11S02596-1]|uniref:type I restriction endonuclease subunit R n=1 Tax=Helicobacter sp. 11S02596-1 TaxID=1476194 RepID=UPI000BA71C5A|nr:type I restriction endonuclease subunit R [Helicobacter sp. 11S02596-1]PAF44195.1 DEAD/DEAH box helicase [Helicobacter sp. 11S02596-1]